MRLRFLAALAFVLPGAVALGDGCYIPERAVRKIPEIIAQQAVLSWKDGVETLVIASALDSEAQKLGWIIPLPAVPDTIEKATPGALKTLDFCIQPRITHDRSREVRDVIIALVIVNLLFGTWLFNRKRFGGLVLLLFLLFILTGLLLPALNTAGAGSVTVSGVQVEKTATVGSYAISIIRPSQSDKLGSWLTDNGFAALPETAGPIVADYISKGWVFAAIKLTRNEAGANVPHPIRVVFPSEEAVYPMKLTAIAGGSPSFELFVIGNKRASCNMLKQDFCDRFTRKDDDEFVDDVKQSHVRYIAAASKCQIGHPAICSLMWNDCVLTKLAGNVDASKMNQDMQFAWTQCEAHQEHFFTHYGARCLGIILFMAVLSIGNILSMIDYAKGRGQSAGFTSFFPKRLLPAAILAVAVGGGFYAIVPKLRDSDVAISRGSAFHSSLSRLLGRIDYSLKTNPEVLKWTDAKLCDFLRQSLRDEKSSAVPNRMTGAELTEEDSPGNFTVERQKDNVVVRVYDRFGTPFVLTFPVTDEHGKPNPQRKAGGSDST
jgi:hypothetical protein